MNAIGPKLTSNGMILKLIKFSLGLLWLLFAMGLGLALGVGPVAAATARHSSQSIPRWAKQFPLSMDVPVEKFLRLEEGVVRQRRWELFAFRPSGATSRDSICLEVGSLYYGSGHGGQFQSGYACGNIARPERPIVFESGFSIKKSLRAPITSSAVITTVVSDEVEAVRFRLKPGPNRRENVQQIGLREARRINLDPFGYVAVDAAHKTCLTGLDVFARGGLLPKSSPDQHCEG